MDDKLTWEQLPLEHQLNCDCDSLAKASITRAMETPQGMGYHPTKPLPMEAVGIFINKQKITLDPTNCLQYQLSKVEAKIFLTSQQGWSEEQFDDVGWDWLHQVVVSKPIMFQLWLSKQHSNFCATGLQMKRLVPQLLVLEGTC